MSFFNINLRTQLAKKSDIYRFKLPNWCYKHVEKFSNKYFKNNSGTVVFPDQTFIPNKLKFSYKYRKGIIIKANKVDKYLELESVLVGISTSVTIHVVEGMGRCNLKNRKRMSHLFLGGHSYILSQEYVINQPFDQIKRHPFTVFIEVGLDTDKETVLNIQTELLESVLRPRFACVDCEMAQTHKKSGRHMCLASVSVIRENGRTLYNSLVTPIDRVKNNVTRITGLTDRKLQGKTDERTAVATVQRIAMDHILVVSDLRNDLKVLNLVNLPKHRMIDLATLDYLRKITGIQSQFMGLKNLAKIILKEEVQGTMHTAFEDATTICKIFNKHKELIREWKTTLP